MKRPDDPREGHHEGDPRRYQHVSVVEALREPERVFHLSLTKPSAFDPVSPAELDALARLGELTSLESLVLSYVEHPLPPLGGLKNLRRLMLTGAALTELPGGVEALDALEELGLLDNPKLDLAAAARRLAQLPSLRSLRLGGKELRAVPDELAGLAHVESLIVDVLPAGATPIARMPALRRLHLAIGAADGLPGLLRELATAPSLTSLTLAAQFSVARKITALPEELGELARLERLGLRFKAVDALPESLARLTSLRVLDLELEKIKGAARKPIAARVPEAKVYWGGDAPAEMPPPPQLEVRRVAGPSGMSALEELFGRAFPEELPSHPPAPSLTPPATENAFEWLVARDRGEGPYLHLFPFFLDCVPQDDFTMPNGDLVYAHFVDPVASAPIEFHLFLHDEGDALGLVPIGDAAALDAHWKRAEDGDLSMPKATERGRVSALRDRSRWIMDLLARGETSAPVVVLEDDAVAQTEPGFADDPARMLHALLGAYLGGRDARLGGLCERAAKSRSRVVRDAGAAMLRVSGGDRRLGPIADLASLRRPNR